jgi:hypothetical protein
MPSQETSVLTRKILGLTGIAFRIVVSLENVTTSPIFSFFTKTCVDGTLKLVPLGLQMIFILLQNISQKDNEN